MLPTDNSARTLEDRLRTIRSVTDHVLSGFDADEVFVELLDRVREVLDADTAAVLRLHESAPELVAEAASGLEDEVRQNSRVPLGQGFAGRIATERKPLIIEDVDDSTVLNPVLLDKGIRSLLGVPLVMDDRVLGVLHVGTLAPRHFTPADVELLQLVADRVVLALRARELASERTAARALQRSLVPQRLPDIPGLELASRYVPADGRGVGGDWYDLFTVPTGHVCITIGDVVGHGLQAAVVMGRLRSTVRAYALEVFDPTVVLERVDRKLQHFEPSQMATVLFAVIDPSLQHMRISLAGHPAPVLAVPGKPAEFLDLPIDPPLGVGRYQRRGAGVEISPGSLLCFFTDGLVERRGVSLDERLQHLREHVTARAPDEVCRTLMARLVASGPTTDDIAMLALRRQVPSDIETFEVVVPAVPSSLHGIRVAVRCWLSAINADADDIADLVVAIGEACSNVVEHAYGPRRGTVTVGLELDGPAGVAARITDTGTWREPRGENRGRGLVLMERASDRIDIDAGPTGTEVVIRRRLRRSSPDDDKVGTAHR